MSSPQSLETVEGLESKLLKFLSFRTIKAGLGGLFYELNVFPIKVVLRLSDLYLPDDTPLIISGESIYDAVSLYTDPSKDTEAHKHLKFREATVMGPEFDQLAFKENAPFLICDKNGVLLEDMNLGYLRFYRAINDCKELVPAIKAVMGAYSALEATWLIKRT